VTTRLEALHQEVTKAKTTCPNSLEFASPYDGRSDTPHDSFQLKLPPASRQVIEMAIDRHTTNKDYGTKKINAALDDVFSKYTKFLDDYEVAATKSILKPSEFNGRTALDGNFRVCLILDGELEQLNGLVHLLTEYTLRRGFDLVKLAGGCSPNQQPNDVMASFRILKQFLRSPHYKSLQSKLIGRKDRPHYMDKVSTVLAPLDQASRSTFEKALIVLPEVLSTAYSRANVMRGWECIDPNNYEQIMDRCPSWRLLNASDKKEVLASIPKLAKHAIYEMGTPTDEKMVELVGHILGMPDTGGVRSSEAGGDTDESDDDDDDDDDDDRNNALPNKKQKTNETPLKDRVLNRFRATNVSCPSNRYFVANRLAISEAQGAASQLKDAIKKSAPDLKFLLADIEAEKKKEAAAAALVAATAAEGKPKCSNKDVFCNYSGTRVTLCGVARCKVAFCKKCCEDGNMTKHKTCIHKVK
jgi:hypothetical protein